MLDDEDQAHDAYWMARALGLAQEAARLGEAPIGAVLVDGETQTLIAEAHNEPITLHDPSGHAENLGDPAGRGGIVQLSLGPD